MQIFILFPDLVAFLSPSAFTTFALASLAASASAAIARWRFSGRRESLLFYEIGGLQTALDYKM